MFWSTGSYGNNYKCYLLKVMGRVILIKLLLDYHHNVHRSEPRLVYFKSQETMKGQYFIDRAHSLSNIEMGAL